MSIKSSCLQIDLFGSCSGLLHRCEASQCCSCCCSPFKPRYRRLVDNIFPSNHEDGLVKSNMEKLIFYALSSPEKLDKIGAYLAQRIGRDLSRHRIGFVFIAVDAMDQLLVTCHSLHLFIESFLKVVQLVLESQDPELQILATKSFVKFAQIEEDTPAYHRSYDFFVDKFSSLCHNNNQNLETRKRLRIAGLIGIKGLIMKAVSNDMQVNIWSDSNMEKIIPSLLFNMNCDDFDELQSSSTNNDTVDGNANERRSSNHKPLLLDPTRPNYDSEASQPDVVATECLRELIHRAVFGHVQNILKPIIIHFNLHHFWETTSNNFAIETFKIIMYSIQPQHSFTVIQILMNHLDHVANDRSETNDIAKIENKIKVQTGIVNVLNEIISIPSDSIGPSVFGMINSLLQHLHDSINNVQTKFVDEEKQFQEAVINTLGEFTTNLPDYQKIETMIFIIEKAPPASCTSATEQQLQNIILKSLLKVTTKYKPVSMVQTFPPNLLNQLLTRALASDPRTRLTVQKIFHQLLDRHKNLPRLFKPITLTSPETMTIEKADRYDVNFMRKYGQDILSHIYQNIQIESNRKENFDSIFTTMALICVEMNSDEVLIDLLRLNFALQDLANAKTSHLNDSHRCYIHSVVAGFLYLFSHLKAIPAICAHVELVIKARSEQARYLLPEYCHMTSTFQAPLFKDSIKPASKTSKKSNESDGDKNVAEHQINNSDAKDSINSPSRQNSFENNLLPDELSFNKHVISEALQTTGHDVSALNTPFQSNCGIDSSMTRSISDLNAITLEIDSANSSPGLARKIPEQEINFNTFKEVLVNKFRDQKQDSKRRIDILNNFKNNKFEDLVDNYAKNNGNLQEVLFDTIDQSIPRYSKRKRNRNNREKINTKDVLDDNGQSNLLESSNDVIINKQPPSQSWNIHYNPLLSLCDQEEISNQSTPLFALRFPNLFVY
ncbi:hypothetical protein NH340_JMT07491 [Sarcoptes scabiei]|nr:hypothetical protein NH340_JMT07491 [Sarcoptes scabiei]